MKKANFIFLCIFVLFLFLPLLTRAFELRSGELVNIQEETIDDNLYVKGATIILENEINGDLFCAGNTVEINSTIKGDIICAANTININGQVDGSVRVLGNTININSKINKNIQAAGASVNIKKDAKIGWDALVFSENLNLEGQVNGDLHGQVKEAKITGTVLKDTKLKEGFLKQQNEQYNTWNFFAGIVSVFSAFIIGLVLINLFKNPLTKTTKIMKKDIKSSFLFGFVTLFLTPIAAVIIMITLIGFPLGIITLILWVIAIYVAKIVSGIFIGQYISDKYFKKEKESLLWSMVLGVALLWFFIGFPYVGWLISLTATIWGLGGIVLNFKKLKNK